MGIRCVLPVNYHRYQASVVGLHLPSRYLALPSKLSFSNHITGFESQKGSRSGWRCWCIAASVALHPATWRPISCASLMLTLVGDCALRVRQHLSVHVLCVLPSVTVPSRQLPHLFRTVCQSQFGHRQFFVVD